MQRDPQLMHEYDTSTSRFCMCSDWEKVCVCEKQFCLCYISKAPLMYVIAIYSPADSPQSL